MFLPQSAPPDSLLQSIINSLPTHSYTPNSDGQPIHLLEDFKKLPLTSDALPSPFLRILHTPGHTADSIAIYIPSDRALYTADTVLGQGTAVFEDLASLIISLRKMLDFEGYTKLYPGHGPVVDDGPALINMYIEHRMKREEEIVQVLGEERSEDILMRDDELADCPIVIGRRRGGRAVGEKRTAGCGQKQEHGENSGQIAQAKKLMGPTTSCHNAQIICNGRRFYYLPTPV